MQLDVVEARAHGRLELHAEVREVLVAHRAALFLDEPGNRARDVAPVEGVARSLEAGLPALPRRFLLLVRHELHGPSQVGLPEDFADFGRAALRQEHFLAGGPPLVILLVLLDELRHHRVHRETVARETDGAGRDVAEAHRSEMFQRGEPRIRRSRHHAALHAFRYLAAVPLHEVVRCNRLGPHAEPIDAMHFLVLRRIDDLGRHSGEIDLVGLQHPDRNARGHAGIDRVAAGLQDLEAGMRGEIMSGGNDVPGSHDGQAVFKP